MKPLLFLLALFLNVPPLQADERIDAALALPKKTENRVYRSTLRANWIDGGKALWYRVETGPGTHEFVLVDTSTGARKTAGDVKELGLPDSDELRTSKLPITLRPSRRTGAESALKFVNQFGADVDLFWIDPQGEHVRYGGIRANSDREQHTFEGHVWLLTSRTGEHLAVVEAQAMPVTIFIDQKGLATEAKPPREKRADQAREGKSPDGRWAATLEKTHVVLRELATGATRELRTDLTDSQTLQPPVQWAPDSQTLVVAASAPVTPRRVTIVESSPKDQLQPKLREFDYDKPGDPLPEPFPVLFRLTEAGGAGISIQRDLFSQPFTQNARLPVRWAPDSREFFFDYNQRGHQLFRILAVNATTGGVRTVVEETSKTFIDYTQKTWRHWLNDSGELLWMSERDGWCHLWLYDAHTGQPKQQITRGAWPVREVLHVDEKQRTIWFMASGLRAGEDPYHEHLCRVQFDGNGFARLTDGDGQHDIEFSPDRSCFIAIWSRADHPPVRELRRTSDGSLICVLETADASALLATGWSLPERFVAKGRDGQTDIHGILIKPSHFDAAKVYPIVEEIYAGPHSAFVPKEFGRLLRQHMLAELGFIVVQVDGMGTNHRGKTFHDVAWKNLKDAGFPDRIAWIREAAKTRPWMDLKRIGIYGGSAGGQTAMRALIDHHDFYRVAVADCGCHDNRMDKIWWNEQWMGWPVDESYARNSNAEDAAKLEGHLLLIVGELDNNVDPASTMQVVGALQRADKAFEFMPMINTGHGAAETPYGSRLRMQFLLKHLQP